MLIRSASFQRLAPRQRRTGVGSHGVRPVCSLVVPFHNEAESIPALVERLRMVLDPLAVTWEMVCVDDGSTDDTLSMLLALHEQDARIRVFALSRNFGKEAALTAGLDNAWGACAIPLDADLQDPPELIPELLAKWQEGYDVVNARRLSRSGESWTKRSSSYGFYRLLNRLSPMKIPEDTGDFRLLSRPVLDALRQLPERRRFMKGLFSWVGFRSTEITYHRSARNHGKSRWSYWRLWNLALDGITSTTQLPLQIATLLGVVVSVLAFLYAVWMVISTLIYGNPVKGYPSLMVAILFLGGVQLLALGVIGEYIGRIHEETKNRPLYIIRQRWQKRPFPQDVE